MQLVVAGLLFAGFVLVFLVGHRRPLTKIRYPRLDSDNTFFFCDACGARSPVSADCRLLMRWGEDHDTKNHPHLAERWR